MRKILLNKSRGKESVNNSNTIPIDLNRDVSLLHDEVMTDTIDIMKLYNEEKDNSNKHRMIFTLYPVCSNSLFNNITEIIYKEGSNDAYALTNSSSIAQSGAVSNTNVNRIHAIRNMEYTNEKFGYTYHCGSDIFNNHLLRAKESVVVQKRKETKTTTIQTGSSASQTIKVDSFNTIGDYTRTQSGDYLKVKIPNSSSYYTYNSFSNCFLPLYTYETIKTFNEAYSDGIKRKDGWMGIFNQTSLNIPITSTTNGDYFVNKCFNNKQGCQFIDMTPERDLFYFTPKKNIYKNRLEHNWFYYITYPSTSVYSDEGSSTNKLLNGKGLPLIEFSENKTFHEYSNDNGIPLALFRSPVKHNLTEGDSVRIMFPETSKSSGETIICKVIKVGTSEGKYKDRYFSVRKSDFEKYLLPSSSPIMPNRFTKHVYGFDCEYYYRKFRKIKNKEFRNNNVNNRIGDDLPRSVINKLAFSDTIYGDEVSQLVFTDDIDVSEILDNRGRPLTEVFLTIIKNNAGYKDWYNTKPIYNSDSVEYSHVFGTVTSGFDLPPYVNEDYVSIRKQHNINNGKTLTVNNVKIADTSSKKIESDITKLQNEFYGDLVEYNPITTNETILEEIYHRFNTAQREYYNTTSTYSTIYYDEIYGDIYDGPYYASTGGTMIKQNTINNGYANLSPEGYIYKPHYRIKIGEFDNIVKQSSCIPINILNNVSFEQNNTIIFYTDENYSLLQGDIITFLNTETKNSYTYRISSYKLNNNNNKGNFIGNAQLFRSMKGAPSSSEKSGDLKWFKYDNSIPFHAYMLPDGSGRCLWKDVKLPSEYTFNDDLYNLPFTNDAFYHHDNITFFVRRQDPFHHYGMFVKDANGIQIDNNFEVPTVEFDGSDYEHIPENNSSTCF